MQIYVARSTGRGTGQHSGRCEHQLRESEKVKIPPLPFTMTEFIELNELGVSSHDVPAVREISAWLRQHGYRRTRRRRKRDVEVCWTDGKRLDGLREKLK